MHSGSDLGYRNSPRSLTHARMNTLLTKAGNPRLRTRLIQLAWFWLRHTPQSALTLWFKERVSGNGGHFKKSTIVALARKLLVALWKYVTAGVVIDGAVMKDA